MQYIRNSLSSLIYTQGPPQSPDANSNLTLSPTMEHQNFSSQNHTYTNGAVITSANNGLNNITVTTTVQPPTQPSQSTTASTAKLSVIQEYDINKSRPYTIATKSDSLHTLKVSEYRNKSHLPTPSDSYHSVLSDFPSDAHKMEGGGITNPAYSHNEGHMGHVNLRRNNPHTPVNNRR